MEREREKEKRTALLEALLVILVESSDALALDRRRDSVAWTASTASCSLVCSFVHPLVRSLVRSVVRSFAVCLLARSTRWTLPSGRLDSSSLLALA